MCHSVAAHTTTVQFSSTQARYQAFITKHSRDHDRVESFGWPIGALVIFLACAARGVLKNYHRVFKAWFVATVPWVLLPGLVAYTHPAFYERRRETVIVASKLACAACYPLFRLSWQAPGGPLDVRAAFGSFLRLPVHPMAVLQCGAVTMMGLSIRHSLRFKAQLLCQLAMGVVAMQAEAAAHRTAASPQQHFLSLRNATLLQLVCGTLWPLVQHYQLDSRRRKLCQQTYLQQQQLLEQQQRRQRRQQQQQQQWAEELQQQTAEVVHGSGPARRRRQSE